MEALPQISEKGNAYAIHALTKRLEDRHSSVRDLAGQALLQIVKGDGVEIVAAIRALASIHDIKFNLKAFLESPEDGDAKAIISAAASTEDIRRCLELAFMDEVCPQWRAEMDRNDYFTGGRESPVAGDKQTSGRSFGVPLIRAAIFALIISMSDWLLGSLNFFFEYAVNDEE